MYLLAIESSCDETSASVVEMDGERGVRRILSDEIASQVPLHTVYGGVVPEIASRAHAEAVTPLTYAALRNAGVSLSDIGAVGVTAYPGLIGALLVGVNFAKSLACSRNIPLVPVSHIRGHAAANYFTHPDLTPPYLAIVASGGHTSILDVRDYTDFRTIGRTRDDAIGEAFDKVARVMGMPYPGGAEMDSIAYLGDPGYLKLPSAAIADDSLDFSFSGVKTAVINFLNTCAQKNEPYDRNGVAASFTQAVVSSVLKKTDLALRRTGRTKLVLAGGVAANSHLRAAFEDYCRIHTNIRLYLPDRALCGDNAAMIGAQAYYEFLAGVRGGADLNACATSRHDADL